jgi:hypothetical protein
VTNPALAGLAQQLLGGAAQAGAQAQQLIAGYYAPPDAGGPPQASDPATSSSSGSSPSGLQVIDWRDLALPSAPAGADGLCTVTFTEVDAAQLWACDRYAVYCTSTTPTACFVYVGPDVRPTNLRDSTASGNLDFGDNSAPLYVPGSRALVFQWEGASVGAVAVGAVQYRLLG